MSSLEKQPKTLAEVEEQGGIFHLTSTPLGSSLLRHLDLSKPVKISSINKVTSYHLLTGFDLTGKPRDVATYLYHTPERYFGHNRYVEEDWNRSMTNAANYKLKPAIVKDFEEQLFEAYKKNPGSAITEKYGTTTGTDPECFALDSKGVVIPAWNYLKAKEAKEIVHWDGVQAELTTTPQTCHDSLVYWVREGLRTIWRYAQVVDPGATLSCQDVVDIPFEMMKSFSGEHAALGCAPSLNVYPDVQPVIVPDPMALPFRFAGCHYHTGLAGLWTGRKEAQKKESAERIVKALDRSLSVIMTSALRGLENPRRRQFYGRPGEYRLPVHGLEYRVASSAVLCHPTMTYLFFDLARALVQLAYRELDFVWKCDQGRAREIINSGDYEEANKVIKENEEVFLALLRCIYAYSDAEKRAATILQGGIQNILPTGNMIANWNLTSLDSHISNARVAALNF